MNAKVIVLDDDPTGTQTVAQVPVLTSWTSEQLADEMIADAPAVFLLTNSRAVCEQDAIRIARETGQQILEAERRSGVRAKIISRSDSTLRGHFPAETVALSRALGNRFHATLLCPFFEGGGRITVGDTHYVRQNGTRVPVGETEFARDSTFGYKSSNLADWIAEKYGSAPPAVVSISIDAARSGASLHALRQIGRGSVVIINAENTSDLRLQIQAVKQAESEGFSYLFRTASDWVAAYAEVPKTPPLDPARLVGGSEAGGLLVVGSYVEKTSEQLKSLLGRGLTAVELTYADVHDLRALDLAAASLSEPIEKGETAMIYTSRERGMAGDLDVGRAFSQAIVKVVRLIGSRPSYVLAKGGITSSDVATGGLGVRRAWVEGQLIPGVSAWRCGAESKWPGMALVVFPGNVGGPDALTKVFEDLERGRMQTNSVASVGGP